MSLLNRTVTEPGSGTARRRPWVRAAALVPAVLVALLVVALVIGNDDEGSSAPPVAGTGTAETSAPATGTPSPARVDAGPAPAGSPDELPPSLPAVALDQPAAVGNGISASVLSVTAIQGTASGPGNVAGPALRVSLRIHNGTGAPVSLDGVAVALTYGADSTPAEPLEDPSRAPFHGTVAAGGAADGIYVFTVPAGDRDTITVSVGYQPGAPFLVFTGSAA
jgi:hypothetical protein